MTALLLFGAISKFLNRRLELKIKKTHYMNLKTQNKLDYGTKNRNSKANSTFLR